LVPGPMVSQEWRRIRTLGIGGTKLPTASGINSGEICERLEWQKSTNT
jgi:hypothetical protein